MKKNIEELLKNQIFQKNKQIYITDCENNLVSGLLFSALRRKNKKEFEEILNKYGFVPNCGTNASSSEENCIFTAAIASGNFFEFNLMLNMHLNSTPNNAYKLLTSGLLPDRYNPTSYTSNNLNSLVRGGSQNILARILYFDSASCMGEVLKNSKLYDALKNQEPKAVLNIDKALYFENKSNFLESNLFYLALKSKSPKNILFLSFFDDFCKNILEDNLVSCESKYNKTHSLYKDQDYYEKDVDKSGFINFSAFEYLLELAIHPEPENKNFGDALEFKDCILKTIDNILLKAVNGAIVPGIQKGTCASWIEMLTIRMITQTGFYKSNEDIINKWFCMLAIDLKMNPTASLDIIESKCVAGNEIKKNLLNKLALYEKEYLQKSIIINCDGNKKNKHKL